MEVTQDIKLKDWAKLGRAGCPSAPGQNISNRLANFTDAFALAGSRRAEDSTPYQTQNYFDADFRSATHVLIRVSKTSIGNAPLPKA